MSFSSRSLPLLLLPVLSCTGTLGTPSSADGDGAGDDATSDGAPPGDSAAAGDPVVGGDPAGPGDPGASGDARPIAGGTILFQEGFEDADWASRGWYDGPNGTLSTTQRVTGASSFECTFLVGQQDCDGGKPARLGFPASETVYLSYWIKYSDNWQGSGVGYHPHQFHFISDADDDWVGPANSHLTAYIESPTGRPMLALQDSRNVDNNCILFNSDNFSGCNGDFSTYNFSESRSVCACNGLVGDVDGRDCYDTGSYWYSSRAWYADGIYFQDSAGPYDKRDWHFVEAYFEMNSIQGGIGVPDGRIRYWLDGQLLISSDAVLMRTGALPNLAFDQFFVGPHIGPGSPVQQSFWVDDLTIATAPP